MLDFILISIVSWGIWTVFKWMFLESTGYYEETKDE